MDIFEEIEEHMQSEDCCDYDHIVEVMELISAEIKRLREELKRYKDGYHGACYACEPVGMLNIQQADEIERLRNVLHRISLGSKNSGTTKESLGREAAEGLEGK